MGSAPKTISIHFPLASFNFGGETHGGHLGFPKIIVGRKLCSCCQSIAPWNGLIELWRTQSGTSMLWESCILLSKCFNAASGYRSRLWSLPPTALCGQPFNAALFAGQLLALINSTFVFMHVSMYYVCRYVRTYMHKNFYIWIRMCTWCAYLHVYAYMHISVCAHAYVHVYVYLNVCM